MAEQPAKITYAKSEKLILDTGPAGANVQEDLNNLPVFIILDKSKIDFDVVKGDLAGNLSFSTSDGSFLPYEIQAWNKEDKSAEILIIVPLVSGNNNSQFITMSWGKKIASNIEKELKVRIDRKNNHEINSAQSPGTASSHFKSSCGIYGEWSSNKENGFTVIFDENDSEITIE